MAGSSQAHQQEARSAANLESSPGSQCRSSVASTEHPAGGQPTVVADKPEHYPVDDITVRTPCELLYQQRKKIKLVDRVEPGWEDLDLEIPGGDGEEELGHAMHTWICWNKRYIRLAGLHFADTPTPSSEPANSPAAQRGSSVAPKNTPTPAPKRSPTLAPRSPPAPQRSPSPAPRSAPAAEKSPSPAPDDARDSSAS